MVTNNNISMNTVAAYAKKHQIPYQVTMELNTTCNYKCIHCYLPEHKNQGLETEKVIRIFRELREIGTLSLVLTGGEIFLRKDLMYIIRTARKMGFSVTLLSNASLLDEATIKELAELHINSFSTTVFSLDSKINCEITQSDENTFIKMIDNILMMKEYGIRVEVKTPLMVNNRFEYRDLKEFCNHHNIKYTPSTLISKRCNGDVETQKLRLNDEDFRTVFLELQKELAGGDDNPREFYEANMPCPSIEYSFYIDSYGDVYPCNSFYYKIGNVREMTVSQIWKESEELKRLKTIRNRELVQCVKCNIRDYCTRCPGHALLEDNNMLGCSSLDKRFAILFAETYGVNYFEK